MEKKMKTAFLSKTLAEIKDSFEGPLEKQSPAGVKPWQARYCIIKDRVFYYYKKKNGTLSGCVNLDLI
jgi:hypothetical protein